MGGRGSGGFRANARRPIEKATIKKGAGLFITQVYPDGTADLGRGKATIERLGNDRLIKIAQDDGSEIRILVVGQ